MGECDYEGLIRYAVQGETDPLTHAVDNGIKDLML
jgi:hypothetical protein